MYLLFSLHLSWALMLAVASSLQNTLNTPQRTAQEHGSTHRMGGGPRVPLSATSRGNHTPREQPGAAVHG